MGVIPAVYARYHETGRGPVRARPWLRAALESMGGARMGLAGSDIRRDTVNETAAAPRCGCAMPRGTVASPLPGAVPGVDAERIVGLRETMRSLEAQHSFHKEEARRHVAEMRRLEEDHRRVRSAIVEAAGLGPPRYLDSDI